MPALSSTMTEGKIVEWLKQPGDKVGRGESVLVVESDKADMDVESFQDGYLAVVLMPAGSSAPVGETIGLIVDPGEYRPEIDLFTRGFKGLFLINCQSSLLIPNKNKLGSKEGEECIATISPE